MTFNITPLNQQKRTDSLQPQLPLQGKSDVNLKLATSNFGSANQFAAHAVKSVDNLLSLNPLRRYLALKKLSSEVNLLSAFELKEQYEKAPRRLKARINNLFHEITKENYDASIVLGHSPLRRIKIISEIVSRGALPILRQTFPLQPLEVWDVGASSGRVALGVSQKLGIQGGKYHITDRISQYRQLTDSNGNIAIFCNARKMPLQLITHDQLFRFSADETKVSPALPDALYTLLDYFILQNSYLEKQQDEMCDVTVKKISACCPAVDIAARSTTSGVIFKGYDLFEERMAAEHAHLTITSSCVEPGYMKLAKIVRALKVIGKNTIDGGVVVIVNEVFTGRYTGEISHTPCFSIFQRQEDSLILIDKSGGMQERNGGLNDFRPWLGQSSSDGRQDANVFIDTINLLVNGFKE